MFLVLTLKVWDFQAKKGFFLKGPLIGPVKARHALY